MSCGVEGTSIGRLDIRSRRVQEGGWRRGRTGGARGDEGGLARGEGGARGGGDEGGALLRARTRTLYWVLCSRFVKDVQQHLSRREFTST